MNKLIAVFALVLIGACSNDDNDNNVVNDNRTFEITITNLTTGQPLSPIGVFLHDSSQQAFSVGSTAPAALEVMAEAGDVSELVDAIDSIAEMAGEAPVGPGGSDSFTLSVAAVDLSDLELTVMTMLVNTNDAITGVNGAGIADLGVGETRRWNTMAYDAGTEANSEQAGTIPGPADGGEGFNAARDDIADQVTLHPGVVTSDDGLASSVLNQAHRFDNPVTRVQITRTE